MPPRERRWKAGWSHTEAGLPMRVVQGRKSPDDLRIEWRTPDGWRPVTMAAGAILADFWMENEDVLYPPPAMGGRYYLAYLSDAAHRGWEAAEAKLRSERAAKEQRQAAPVAPTQMHCGAPSPDRSERCSQGSGHAGPHKGAEWVWPQEKAS